MTDDLKTLTIEKVVQGGKGLARMDGQVVLVDRVLPGEEVQVSLRPRKGVLDGILQDVLLPSATRISPDCPFYSRCGGCDFRHTDYQRELEKVVTTRTRQLQKALNSVKKASLETIHRLSRAAEYKDEDTGAHIIRMSRYAAAIASEIGLNKKTVETIFYAAPMHDVGKIGIPEEILNKTGPLTPEEKEGLEEHVMIGVEIISSVDILVPALPYIQYHQERWDGKRGDDLCFPGYFGLKGEEIPLGARILAVADSWDAMTSERPYRRALPAEAALKEICENSGIQFDPEITAAFLRVLKDEMDTDARQCINAEQFLKVAN